MRLALRVPQNGFCMSLDRSSSVVRASGYDPDGHGFDSRHAKPPWLKTKAPEHESVHHEAGGHSVALLDRLVAVNWQKLGRCHRQHRMSPCRFAGGLLVRGSRTPRTIVAAHVWSSAAAAPLDPTRWKRFTTVCPTRISANVLCDSGEQSFAQRPPFSELAASYLATR